MDNSVELKKGRKNRDKKRALVAYSFIAPNFIGFAVFTLVPIVCAFALGFLKWDGNNPIQFVGLENFKELGGDSMFWASLKNTIIYCVGTVPLTMIASLALAIILNQKIKARGFFRTVAFFPYVASLVAITAVWAMIFHPSKGPINAVLYYVFHMEELPNWFGKDLILLTLILFSVWKYMGYYMVIYLAGLQGINTELYEAASIDGVNTWQKKIEKPGPYARYVCTTAVLPKNSMGAAEQGKTAREKSSVSTMERSPGLCWILLKRSL